MVAEANLLYDFVNLMAESPSPEEILDFKASAKEEERIAYLIAGSKSNSLTLAEQLEAQYFLKLEGAIALAKAKAFVKLKGLANE